MRKNPRKTRNVIITSIVATAVSGILLNYLLELDIGAKVVSGVWWLLKGTWKLLADTYELPGWLILVLGFGSVLRLTSASQSRMGGRPRMKRRLQGPSAFAPDILKEYTSDTIYGVEWRWDRVRGDISNLHPVCPTCGATLVYSEDFGRDTKLICEPCSNIVQDHLKHQGTTVLDFGRPKVVVDVNNIDLDGLHASVKRGIRRVAMKRSQEGERADANGGS